MRYSKKELALIRRSYKNLDIDTIRLVLQDHGFNRTNKSIETQVIKIQEQAKASKKALFVTWANTNLLAYRTNTLYNAAKQRSKTKNLSFSITKEWIKEKLLEGKCEATGIGFKLTKCGEGKEKTNPYAPSIDRVDSSKGYTLDNCQMTILAFNKFKSDTLEHDIIEIAEKILEIHSRKRQLRLDAA